MARPMPLVEPVTTAFLPLRLMNHSGVAGRSLLERSPSACHPKRGLSLALGRSHGRALPLRPSGNQAPAATLRPITMP